METKKTKKEGIVNKVLKKVLQETNKNPMMVGRQGKYCLYLPHNYRLYIDFDKGGFKPNRTAPKSAVGSAVKPSLPMEHKPLNKTEHSYNNFIGCRITVKKTQIEIINKIKEWYKVYLTDIGAIKRQIKDITLKKDKECLRALKCFISHYGGKSEYRILNRSSEDKVQGEDIINLLPIKMKFHSPPVKKVYNEKNIEFSDAAFASNYLRNRAIEDIAPEITQELKENKELVRGILQINASTSKLFNQFSNTFLPIFTEYSRDVKVHNKVENEIEKAFKKFNRLLSQRQTKIGDFR